MADLLTQADYRAIAAALVPPQNAWIDGTEVSALLGRPPGIVEPAIIEVNDRQSHLLREEIFGPVLSVITVNSFDEGDITTPFGGYQQSGFGGRDSSIHAHDQYTQLKTIWLGLTDHAGNAID